MEEYSVCRDRNEGTNEQWRNTVFDPRRGMFTEHMMACSHIQIQIFTDSSTVILQNDPFDECLLLVACTQKMSIRCLHSTDLLHGLTHFICLLKLGSNDLFGQGPLISDVSKGA